LSAEELEIYTSVTNRPAPPSHNELWIIAGRRSGKTRIIATICAYLSGCCDLRTALGPGERGILPVLAGSTVQARTALDFRKGDIRSGSAVSSTGRECDG
jgi:hypothetical protein